MSRTADAELVQQRARVEGLEAEPGRDLLARRPRPLAEEVAQPRTGFGAPPPVLPDLVDELAAELRRADPGSEVVRRVEARIHVREVVLARVADAGGLGQPLGVAVRSAAVVAEAAPELELELELRRVAAEQERLEKDGR